MNEFVIRPATPADNARIWDILRPVFRAGDTYTIDKGISEDDAIAYWLSDENETFVALLAGDIVGTYYLRTNQAGGGAHICNCGYITDAHAAGRGIARRMCLHSIEVARGRGYRGMQFNFVVSSNVRAIGLWESLGFETVGRLPAAFNHPSGEYVDALVMFRSLATG